MLPPDPALLGESLRPWTLAALTAGLVLGTPWLLKSLVLRYERVPASHGGFCLGEALGATRFPLVLLMGLWAGSRFLATEPWQDRALFHLALMALLLQVGLWGNRLIGCWLHTCLRLRHAQADTTTLTAPVLGFMLRLVLWSLVLLVALDTYGINLTALLASLGVGGIAVALAVQNILGDIFASLSIALDKPFVPGDFIIVGECLGTVDNIGLKSTQIRSLSGEQVIVSNADLLRSRIRNFKRMSERRVAFGFGVTYRLDAERLEGIPGQVRAIIEALPGVRFDRAHLKEFGESALVFEVVYYVLGADYNLYMDIQQAINFGIFRALRGVGVEFAHPTRVLVPLDPGARP